MPACGSRPCSTSMNSGSSCDSMASINSGFSDDSMEHLSAEERACLMYLEEAIESLETEDDSGLSNDEPSWPPRALAARTGHLASASPTKPEELSFHNDSNRVLGNNHKAHGLLVPTPLVLANGSAQFLKKTEIGTPLQETVNEANASALNFYHPSAALTARKPASSPQNPGTHKPDEPPSFIPEPPVKPGTAIQPKAKEGPAKIQLDIRPDHRSKGATPDMLPELIPPPSDFMDEPDHLHQQPQSQSQPQLPPQPQLEPPPGNRVNAPPSGFGRQARDDKPPGTENASPGGLLSPCELDKLREKASMKKNRKISQKWLDQSGSPPSSPDSCHVTAEHGEPKSAPAVAPKPKKFPSSIIMKSHKDSGPSHSLVPHSDHTLVNQQKVHVEALKKLGLLKGVEEDSSPTVSPPHRVPPPAAEAVEARGKTVSLLSSPPFSEKGGRQSPTVLRGSSSRVFKSASMKQSDMGKNVAVKQSSTIKGQGKAPEKANVELSPGQLQQNLSRPAFSGSLKDLSIHQPPSNLKEEPNIRKSLPSSTMPGTHGISVVISPQSKNGEDRKQALRKLGLIRD
ncbi:hypothetical protein P4O66_020941 [Electrophorus voltai]|uniref:Specifically androgen-regulated gene protein n=1 Tax=Electrophorus voltai TaxID=2609070 RepID=A0AAD8ZQP4_9TELE|nr:hypothetical protein P4O66_020941 [Electrophorus voltai]